jgi:site-specific DNA-methyltransferase (adenine-specific)
VPEDTRREDGHYASFPPDLCRLPIIATCPPDGVVLDPFCGTGTTNLVSFELGRASVGVDISPAYLDVAQQRCQRLL